MDWIKAQRKAIHKLGKQIKYHRQSAAQYERWLEFHKGEAAKLRSYIDKLEATFGKGGSEASDDQG